MPIVVNLLFGVDLEYDDVALTLTMDNFQDRYIDPVMARIANEIDATGMQQFSNIYNSEGLPNAVLTNRIDYLNQGVILDNTATPRRGKGSRTYVMSPQMQANLADSQASLFNRQSSIAEQYDTGEMGDALGWKFTMDQNVSAMTIGALNGVNALQVNGANQTGSSIICTNAGTVVNYFNGAETITFSGVYGIVPNTATKTGGGISTGALQQFVVQSAATSAAGALTISISPPIITAGAFQNCTNSPATLANVAVFGNTTGAYAGLTIKNALGFHQQAFTRVMVDLPVPGGVDMGGRIRDKASGLAFRLVRAYDIRGNTRPTRVEALWGWSTLYPEWAVRGISSS